MENSHPLRKIVSLFSKPAQKIDPELLQESFRKRYLSFRSLLTANNNALELMAEMEDALAKGQPFGMAFVRGNCTALAVNVYKIIQNLQEISAGKYESLSEAFENNSGRIEKIVARQPESPRGKLVVSLKGIGREDADLVGDKMANLGEVLNRAGLSVPEGFVITAAATRRFMSASSLQDEINRLLKTLDIDNLENLYSISAKVQSLISGAPVPEELAAEILHYYRKLAPRSGAGPLISMRSSAVEEDRSMTTFAGQYRTQLNVSEEFILQTFKEIVASKYMSQAIVYRHQRGFQHQDVMMCVGCLAMVDADVSGVMFSRSPRKRDSSWVEIYSAPGLASQVVSGRAEADFYRVERNSPFTAMQRELRDPDFSLTDERLSELAGIAVRLEQHFGGPQDIEWSIDLSGKVFILQSRPLAQPDEAANTGETGAEAVCGENTLLRGGLAVSRGVAAGPVFIVRSNADLLEFPAGAVLVVENPLPEWTSLINKAVALISESGHAATHLAIVAREFGKPAVFGLKEAASRLGNDVIVTVDADSRCIYYGRDEESLKRAAPPPNLMAGSPVYLLLREIMDQILPLNLTDPGSPFFKPSHCQTYHDITRFCHEKAVTEMFSFGEKAGFDPRTAKQLVDKAPFKWWVIDLDDGFREGFEPNQQYVGIDDIISEPMLAIWEGMTAKPWQGPPPVNLKGFGSILFRSTMNPSLEPAVRASLGMKSYFLISKNFCNLSMRLGYHFTLVEAYLGSHITENYVSFQFRGGAADRNRRFIRVSLLGDILEQFGFRVEVRQDALTARIEKKQKKDLVNGLRILGYLLIHTRQIDMVMGEKVMVDRYRQQILEDLRDLVAAHSQ